MENLYQKGKVEETVKNKIYEILIVYGLNKINEIKFKKKTRQK